MRRIAFTAWIAAAGSAWLAGCDAPRVSETIVGPKVLAIQAEPATVRPGESVTLTALVVAPDPDAELGLTWKLCPHADFEECVLDEELVTIGAGDRVTLTVPSSAFEGDSYAVFLDVEAGGFRERSVKPVPVRAASEPRNHNPVLDRVRWRDPLLVPPGASPGLQVVRPNDRVHFRIGSSVMINEIFDDSGTPAAEDVQVRTYTTGGALVDPSGSGASGALYYRAPDKGGDYRAWVVVADGRGGVAWTGQAFRVEGEAR